MIAVAVTAAAVWLITAVAVVATTPAVRTAATFAAAIITAASKFVERLRQRRLRQQAWHQHHRSCKTQSIAATDSAITLCSALLLRTRDDKKGIANSNGFAC